MEQRVRRKRYMDQLRAGRGLMDVVKVVTGMRRAGKSTLLEMYADELVSDGVRPEDIVSINLETFEYRDIRDRRSLDDVLLDAIGGSGTKYVFLDEVQNVRGWEESVSSLVNTRRCDVYITGSNSRMLSSDLVTHISGRFVEIGILPLSFAEYMELHPGDRDLRFNQYSFSLAASLSAELVPGRLSVSSLTITSDFIRAEWNGYVDLGRLLPAGDFSVTLTETGTTQQVPTLGTVTLSE